MSAEKNKPGLSWQVESYLEAYQTKNRDLLNSLLHADFVFTSPQDNRIDKAAYFKRCWPFSDSEPVYRIVDSAQSGTTVFVLYVCKTNKKKSFRNTEYIHMKEDKILEIEVYFGREEAC